MRFSYIIRLLLLTAVFTASWSSVCAQYTSNDGTFSVNEIKGCTPLSITITSNEPTCPCDATCPCDIWLDATNNPNDFNQNTLNVTYNTPGIYTMQVQLQNFNKDVIQIEVVDNTAPDFTLTTCTANQVNVEIQDTNFDTYEVDYNDGTIIIVNNGQLVPTYTYGTMGTKSVNVRGINTNSSDNCVQNNSKNVVILPALQDASMNSLVLQSVTEALLGYVPQPNTNYHLQLAINNDTNFQRYLTDSVDPNQNTVTISDSNIDFERNYYCFRIATFDKCSNSYTGFSNTICSIDLNNIAVGNNELSLDWNSANTNVNEYIITKNTDVNYARVQTNIFTDSNNLICNTDYCYTVIADHSTNGSITSTSLERCETAVSSDVPSAITNISISVSEPNIDLTWELPVGFTPTEYHLYRSGNKLPDTLIVNSLVDNDIEQSCYKIDYTDACFNVSDMSNEVCSIYLNHNISAGIVNLTWNNYEGWSNGVSEYLVVVESSSGNISYSTSSNNFQLPEETTNTQRIKVTIQAVPVDSNLANINSNRIEIINSANIKFPNAFAPNGVNTTFNVKGRYIETLSIKIYTRWGELVASITDRETGWDGTINGKSASGGTYIYIAEVTDEAGYVHSRTGSVLLIRN